MASLLRQIVAGPRARHPEAGLDLCYVTDSIIATSGPSSTYPKKAYRNPTDQLVKFLDYKHDVDWSIWEFRAEGTGYPDSEVYGRIHHFPWPDHHPPPFALLPRIVGSMRKWLHYEDEEEVHGGQKLLRKKRVCVVHCKAGKGRSGTVACSYLISQEGWTKEDAIERFTQRRMRQGFGAGVSIPSQVRWVGYVERWTTDLKKKYVERPVEIVEIHVWGLREGVKVAVEGYVEDGRRIESFHVFTRKEKTTVDEGKKKDSNSSPSNESNRNLTNPSETILTSPQVQSPQQSTTSVTASSVQSTQSNTSSTSLATPAGQTILLRPEKPIIIPTSDINIDFERRNTVAYSNYTLVTSVAHVWFNPYFEGGSDGFSSGVFEIEWEAMDGIKGSARKGTKALDRVKILWKYAKSPTEPAEEGDDRIGRVITEPGKGEPIEEGRPTDWRGPKTAHEKATTEPTSGLKSGRHGGAALTAGTIIEAAADTVGKDLGLRKDRPESVEDVSRANSVRDSSHYDAPPSDGSEHPYPGHIADGGHENAGTPSNAHDQSDTTPLTTESSPSASGFGKGPKSLAPQSAEQEAVTQDSGAGTGVGSAAETSKLDDVGRDRGHEPVHVKGPEGEEIVSYEDGESDEEAIAPSNKKEPESKGIASLGLGKLSGIVDKFRPGGSEAGHERDAKATTSNT